MGYMRPCPLAGFSPCPGKPNDCMAFHPTGGCKFLGIKLSAMMTDEKPTIKRKGKKDGKKRVSDSDK